MSKAAEDIRIAHALLREAIGTPRQALAQAHLEVTVRRVQREQDESRARGAR